jgi:hypothetical protein
MVSLRSPWLTRLEVKARRASTAEEMLLFIGHGFHLFNSTSLETRSSKQIAGLVCRHTAVF